MRLTLQNVRHTLQNVLAMELCILILYIVQFLASVFI